MEDDLNLENLVNKLDSPFSEEIMLAEVPPKFKLLIMSPMT